MLRIALAAALILSASPTLAETKIGKTKPDTSNRHDQDGEKGYIAGCSATAIITGARVCDELPGSNKYNKSNKKVDRPERVPSKPPEIQMNDDGTTSIDISPQ